MILNNTQQSQWLLKADLLRIFSNCFAYPDESRIVATKELVDEIFSTELFHSSTASILHLLLKFLTNTSLQEEYSKIFVQGGIPLSETAYNPSLDIYSELSAFYHAFGVQPKSGDAPDTLPYELEFLGVLCLKIALAQDKDQQTVAGQAYVQFIHHHLLPLVEKLHQKLEKPFAESIYTQLSDLLKKFLQQENRTFNMN